MPARTTSSLPPLLPQPKEVRRKAGSLRLVDRIPIVLGRRSDDSDFETACALQRSLARSCRVEAAVETHLHCGDLGPRIELHREGEEGQSYRLQVDREKVEVRASGPAGLRYAVETLVQLADGRRALPCCTIEDAPDFARRGILLDVSRGKVPTLQTLRALVDRCVRLKLNVLMLYVEHTFRFRRHPAIGKGTSPLDAATLRALDAYAAARHVELIPCLQSLGHMEHVLRIRRYAALAETEKRWTLTPVDPRTYELLRDLYAEFLPNFRSPLFNANCDEPFDLGKGRAAERAAELGPGGLYLEHVRRVRHLASGLGKRAMIWGDVVHDHPERIPEIPRDMILLDWGYEADHDTARSKAFARHGLEFWVCPGTSSWNALFPRVENACRNIARWAEAGRRHGASGLLVTDWGDFGHYNLLGHSWFGYAYAAQHAWSGAVPEARLEGGFGRCLFDDRSPTAARLYRELGRCHEAGFRVANGSPVQFFYFDDVTEGVFVRGAKAGPLRRTLAALQRARRRLAQSAARFGGDRITHDELVLAADTSELAVRKALAGLRYLAWRDEKGAMKRPERTQLARELETLAEEQRELGRRLHELWLARSEPSNFEIVKRRLDRSIRGLRRAAEQLRRNRNPGPLPPHPGFEPRTVLAELRRSSGLE